MAELVASVDGIAAIDPGRGSGPAHTATTTTTRATTAPAPASGQSPVVAPTSGASAVGTVVSLVVVIADVAVLLAMLAAARSRRLMSVPAFWTGRFLPVLGAGLAVLLAVTWFQFGGLPRGYDTYGRVSVPGQRVLALPAGVVTLDFENGLNFAGTDNASEIHTPPGMVVRVTAVARPAAPLTVDRVPTWLFESDSQNYGHKPWGRDSRPRRGALPGGDQPCRPPIAVLSKPGRRRDHGTVRRADDRRRGGSLDAAGFAAGRRAPVRAGALSPRSVFRTCF